jgi:hypothetical protein
LFRKFKGPWTILLGKRIGTTSKALSTIKESVKYIKYLIDIGNQKGFHMIFCTSGKLMWLKSISL